MNNSYQKSIDSVLENLEKIFTTANFYWQSISVIICLVAAIIFYKFIKKSFFPNYNRRVKPTNLSQRYYIPLLPPVLMAISLVIGSAIFSNFSKNIFLFETTIQLIAIFIFLRYLRILFNSTTIANLVGFFLIPAIILHIADLYGPTVSFLDSFYVNVGRIKISIYTVLQAIVVLSVVFWASGVISRKSKSYLSKKDLKTSTKGIIAKFIDIVIYFIVFIIVLRVFGVDMTTFAVIGGAIGVGIGFGLQKISSNFISGIVLLMEKSVEIGDIVELDNGNIYGTITRFGGRYTLIEATDGREIMVPNEDFITGKVTNWTYNSNRGRIEIKILISYDSDIKKAREIILQCAKDHPRCLSYPEAECFIDSFNDNGAHVTAYFWVADVVAGRMGPKNDVMLKILEKFKENNIHIPSQQREVVLRRH
ncbi:MAG: mechanosensitive ion channel [Rickettsiaceae bacterium]|jgi:small-conductance mechanosensitive channel|nr:mechanosensitive ion channel [Rickettsiaceae bacterium]